MRLQQYLSQQGFCSRRKGEDWIKKGWVSVNGAVVTQMGVQINPETDRVEVAKEATSQKTTTLAIYKPRGILTNCPGPNEKEVRDILPKAYRHLSSIGRLDKESEGLILFTDHGPTAKRYLDPKQPHEREYHVWINQEISNAQIVLLEKGIKILGATTKPLTITRLGEKQLRFVMTEGKNRQIRRMLRHVGLKVTRLKRTRFGEITLEGLEPGQYRQL